MEPAFKDGSLQVQSIAHCPQLHRVSRLAHGHRRVAESGAGFWQRSDADHQSSNFASGATVTYHDPQGNSYPGHSTIFVSSGQLTDSAFNNTNDGGTWTVTVVNPSGSSSTAFNFTVN